MKEAIVIILVIFLCISCMKKIDKGASIKVNGFVMDTVKNKRLVSAKVYLVGCKHNFSNGSVYCSQRLDSALTDVNGNFSINYKAEGRSVDYVLEVSSDNKHSPIQYEQFHFAHDAYDVRLLAQELNFLKIDLRVDYNRYDTFYLYRNYAYQTQLIGRSIDTTIFLKVLPNNRNVISYGILYRGQDTSIIFRKLQDTINIGLVDTTTINKRINSTYQMPLSNN